MSKASIENEWLNYLSPHPWPNLFFLILIVNDWIWHDKTLFLFMGLLVLIFIFFLPNLAVVETILGTQQQIKNLLNNHLEAQIPYAKWCIVPKIWKNPLHMDYEPFKNDTYG